MLLFLRADSPGGASNYHISVEVNLIGVLLDSDIHIKLR